MHNYTLLVKLLLITLFVVGISGCGYRPSAKYARGVLGKKISTSVDISLSNPENSVLVKDAVDSAIIKIFHASIVDEKYADTHLQMQVSNPIYTPLQYNDNGFVISYRATISLQIRRETKNLIKHYSSIGTYDFSVVPNSVLTDQERFDAIKYGALKAISAFVAQVSAEGTQIN